MVLGCNDLKDVYSSEFSILSVWKWRKIYITYHFFSMLTWYELGNHSVTSLFRTEWVKTFVFSTVHNIIVWMIFHITLKFCWLKPFYIPCKLRLTGRFCFTSVELTRYLLKNLCLELKKDDHAYYDDLVQEGSISSALLLAMKILQSCTKPSIYDPGISVTISHLEYQLVMTALGMFLFIDHVQLNGLN